MSTTMTSTAERLSRYRSALAAAPDRAAMISWSSESAPPGASGPVVAVKDNIDVQAMVTTN
ncbi:MAG: hypothetical protein JWO63_523, partial [Frankiales bacterium]|nr:hypothetical protein [Frankiales bacterium]